MTDHMDEARKLIHHIEHDRCQYWEEKRSKCDCSFNRGPCRHDVELATTALQAAYESGKAEERERCVNKAREYAEFYDQGTDGRNTFTIFADHIQVTSHD